MAKTPAVSLILALTVAALEFGWTNGICSSNFLPLTFELGPFLPGFELIPHPKDLLVDSYRFSCEGRVTHWEAYTSGNGAHPIEFQVWRNQPELLRYELVGVNNFTEATPTNGRLQLSVPLAEQIPVRPGDFVGISTMEGTEPDPFQLQRISGYYVDYNLTERGYSDAPEELRLRTLSPNGQLCFLTSAVPNNVTAMPLINAVLTTASDSTSSNLSTTNSPATDPLTTTQPLLISTAILAGLLVLLLLFFTVTLVLLCCCMRQTRREVITKQSPSSSQHTQGQLPLTTNLAYNSVAGEETELSPNQAYNNRTEGMTDTTKESTEPYYSRIIT